MKTNTDLRDALTDLYNAGRWMLPLAEVSLERQIQLWEAAKSAIDSLPLPMSERMLCLCYAIEASPASEQLTKCSVLAAQLRRELEIYEQTRPLYTDEKALINDAWKRFDGASLNTVSIAAQS